MDDNLFAQYARDIKKRGIGFWHRSLLGRQTSIFLRWLDSQGISLAQVDGGVLTRYLKHRQAQGNKRQTLIQALGVLRHFFRYLVEINIVHRNPTEGISIRWLDIPGGLRGYQGPLRRVLKGSYALWKFRLSLFAPHWEAYINNLADQSYTKRTLFQVMEHNFYFHRYLTDKKIQDFSLITPGSLRAYLRYKAKHFQEKHGYSMPLYYQLHINGLIKNFLVFAFQQRGRPFFPPKPKQENTVLPDSLLDRHNDFCRIHRGLSPSTLSAYRRYLLSLGVFLNHEGIRQLNAVTIKDLDAFLVKEAERLNPKSLQYVVSALRSFFRFLHLHGEINSDIARVLISPSRFRSDLRPKYLPWPKIQKLLASIDRSHRFGKRDYAILMLLAHHGLRAREAAALRISDIDWDKHSMFLRHRKDGTSVQMPTSPQTEEALRDYLAVRSACPAPEIFLTESAPMKPFERAVYGVARRHILKVFGKLPFSQGAHLLRHSFAKALLDRGAKLQEVGVLLGHRSLRNTQMYTRIATEELREVADNYANLL